MWEQFVNYLTNQDFIANSAAQGVIGMVMDNLLLVVLVVFGFLSYQLYEKVRFGGWTVHIVKFDPKTGKDEIVCERVLSIESAQEIFGDDVKFAVVLKGLASNYGWLNEDLGGSKAAEIGLIGVFQSAKVIVINFNNNPKSAPAPKPASAADIAAEVFKLMQATEVEEQAEIAAQPLQIFIVPDNELSTWQADETQLTFVAESRRERYVRLMQATNKIIEIVDLTK